MEKKESAIPMIVLLAVLGGGLIVLVKMIMLFLTNSSQGHRSNGETFEDCWNGVEKIQKFNYDSI
jgi:hypothetical protein